MLTNHDVILYVILNLGVIQGIHMSTVQQVFGFLQPIISSSPAILGDSATSTWTPFRIFYYLVFKHSFSFDKN